MKFIDRGRAVCLCLLLTGCAPREAAVREPAFRAERGVVKLEGQTPVRFDVVEAKQGPGLPLPPVTARISAVESLTSPTFAPLAGRVIEARVRLGDRVEKGAQLVLVRTAELSTLERDVRSAELAVNTRSAGVERMRALVESRAGSGNDLILAQSELDEAKLALSAARSRLKSMQIARAEDDTAYWVVAERAGTVIQLEATPGTQVGPERGQPVATVADLAEVLAVADVPQRDAVDLEKGSPAKLYPAGTAGETIAGVVEVVSEVVDPERQTVPVRVRVVNEGHTLRPNAYVDLAFGAAHPRTTVLLPTVSVVRDGPNAVVFVEAKPGSYERRQVVVGRRTRDEVEILSGVNSGEHVVSTNALLLLNALDIEA